VIFDLCDGVFALDCNRKPQAGSQWFHADNVALANKAEGTQTATELNFHREAKRGVGGNVVAGVQEQSTNADVPGDCLQFADGLLRSETERHGKLEFEPGISALFRIGAAGMGDHASMLAFDGLNQQISPEHCPKGRVPPVQSPQPVAIR